MSTLDMLADDIEELKQLCKYCHDLIEMDREEEAAEKLYKAWRTTQDHQYETEELEVDES
jgi:hypothetical protein